MPRAGPKKVRRYNLEFKLKAVKLSQLKGVEVVADLRKDMVRYVPCYGLRRLHSSLGY